MIEIMEGVIGGGKTYSVVLRMLAHWCRGGTVASNVAIKWQAVKDYVQKTRRLDLKDSQFRYFDSVNDESKIMNFHHYTPGGTMELPMLCVWDEAHTFWNARAWKETQTKGHEMLRFLTQSRHTHTDIIFITQSHRNLDAQMARLIQYRWTFRDLAKARIGPIGWPFPTTLACQWDYDGVTCVKRIFQRRKQDIFNLYDSHAMAATYKRDGMVDAVDVGGSPAASGRIPWKKLRFIGIVSAVVAVGLICWNILSRPATALVAVPQPAAPQVAPQAAIPASTSPTNISVSDSTFTVSPPALIDTPDEFMRRVPFPLAGYGCRDGVPTFTVETGEYGRLRLVVGSVCPPFEILATRPGNLDLPEILALDMERNQCVLLIPFLVGKPKQQNSTNQDELRNILVRYNSRGNGGGVHGGNSDRLENDPVNPQGARTGGGLNGFQATGLLPDIPTMPALGDDFMK